jgi:type II secretory pathway pseudopilin PulG
MQISPSESTRVAIKFWLDCLQVLTVAGAVIAAFVTWSNYQEEQEVRLNADRTARAAQQEHVAEQINAIRRELQRPYEEKKLNLYLEAARVLAHLVSTPDYEKERTEARFWELYWGELAFVESLQAEERKNGPLSVERLMVQFCKQYFAAERCVQKPFLSSGPSSVDLAQPHALNLARHASAEVREKWEKIGNELIEPRSQR